MYENVRNSKNYTISIVEHNKKYQLVYGKRVVDPHTFKTYPFAMLTDS